MSAEISATESLFSYGTLQQEEVQLSTFGRKLEGQPATLFGYALKTIEILDPTFVAKNGAHHRNLEFTGVASDSVEGMVFSVTQQELEQADEYEPVGYARVRVKLKSGLEAWVYFYNRE
jgi:gamma-glutamylcyclotransferase (GGCT)/AIG2-like uncharacterized protein YtfP